MLVPPILMDGITGNVCKYWGVTKSMHSDLSGLRHNPL